jgi:hypothetical protein
MFVGLAVARGNHEYNIKNETNPIRKNDHLQQFLMDKKSI